MKYEITKEQIEILFDVSKNAEIRLKEWFPEAFKPELKVGKWYKFESGTLGFYKGDNIESYGVHSTSKDWFSNHAWFFNHNKNEIITEANEQEVFEALKNESVKRGFKDGCFLKYPWYEDDNNIYSPDFKGEKLFKNGIFKFNGVAVFNNGKWAEIIPTITKKEAEKLLNKKII